jgi:hypothetical protein
VAWLVALPEGAAGIPSRREGGGTGMGDLCGRARAAPWMPRRLAGGGWQPWIAGEGRGHGMAPFIEFERGEPEDAGGGRRGSLNGAFHSRRARRRRGCRGRAPLRDWGAGGEGRGRSHGDCGRPRYQHIE